ncbi:MAG: hypothetical protein AB7P08_17500 [Burkholderiales bacterium]
MDVAHSTAALLDLIEKDRARRCAEVEEKAAQAATQALRAARSAARTRVREALLVERRRLRDGLAASDAALATETRLHDQRRFRALLDETWKRLPQALAARWAEPAAREAWIAHIVACARAVLAPGRWTFVHGPGWTEEEREATASLLMEIGISAQFTEDATRGPGVEVRSDGNRVDGTAAGLMADAGEVGARLLEILSPGKEGPPA